MIPRKRKSCNFAFAVYYLALINGTVKFWPLRKRNIFVSLHIKQKLKRLPRNPTCVLYKGESWRHEIPGPKLTQQIWPRCSWQPSLSLEWSRKLGMKFHLKLGLSRNDWRGIQPLSRTNEKARHEKFQVVSEQKIGLGAHGSQAQNIYWALYTAKLTEFYIMCNIIIIVKSYTN